MPDPGDRPNFRLTAEETKRIEWLTDHNHKRLGKRHRKAAEELAVAQVVLERQGDDDDG